MRTRTIHLRVIDESCNILAQRAAQIGISLTAYCALVLASATSGLFDEHIARHVFDKQKKCSKREQL